MANYATLKAAINAVIKANGQREITGTVLNQTLNAMVNSLGADYQLVGVATPSTNPGTPDQNVFYLAFEAGTYTNFNATVLSAGISILMWNGSWSSQTFYTIDATPTASSNNLVSSGAVFDAIKTDGSAYDISEHFPTSGPNSDGKFTLEYILSNANTLIPAAWRKGGMSIRFVDSSDNKYVQYRLASPTWSIDIHDWTSEDPYFVDKIMQEVNEAINEHTPIEITGDVTNAPDEEDLTSVNVGGTDVLKFKDKAYNPLTYSGMGRVYLRKNMINGVNTLTQDMFYKGEVGSREPNTNTIFVIQYDFTLGKDITIPANCVLEFDGGSISGNGTGKDTITGNNTGINAGLIKIFSTDVTIDGTWNVVEAYPEWFGAVANKSDAIGNREKIQKCVDSFGLTALLGMYYLNDADANGVGISLTNGKRMIGTSGVANALNNPTTGIVSTSASIQKMIVLDSGNTLENFEIIGLNDAYDTTDNSIAIYCNSEKGRFVLKNLDITQFRYGIQMNCWMGLFDTVICHSVCGGFCFNKGNSVLMTSLTLRNCYTYGFTEFCFYFYHVVYSTLISCAADTEKYDLVDDNNYFGAYCFEGCGKIKMVRCGNEDTSRCVSLLDCRNVDVDIYHVGVFNQTYSSRFEKTIFTNRIIDCRVSVWSVWNNLPTTFKYAYLNGRTDYGHNVFHNIPLERISVFAGGSTSYIEAERFIDLDIKGGIVETENVSYNKSLNYSWLYPTFYNYSFTNNETFYTTDSEWYDDYHTKTLKFEASSYGGIRLSLDGLKPKEFRGFKQVIFKNLIITDDITRAGFIGDCIFKFIGCGDVVFENCYFRTKRPSISAYINADCHVKVVNCAMICTDASPNESLSFADGIVMSKISSTTLISMTGLLSDAGKRKYLPEGTKIVFSDGTSATNIGNTIQAHAEVIVPSGEQVSDVFSTLSVAEKALLVGSCAFNGTNRYVFNGTAWVDATGA